MIPVLSVEDMRRSDATAIAEGTPARELMFQAGQAFFRAFPWKGPVAVVCGKGNNAGDGYVLASLLSDAGIACELFLENEQFSPEGQYWFGQCQEREIPVRFWRDVTSFSSYACIADCLFGTGFHGSVQGESARIIQLINESGASVVSADINSGLDGDSGLAETAVSSDLTVSFGFFQPGHFLNQAKDLMREKINCDIGIRPTGKDAWLLEAADVAACFPPRRHFSNKGTYGTVALIGGSLPYPGAIRLAEMANAAMRSGAGIVRCAVPGTLWASLMPLVLESTLFPLTDRDGQMIFDPEEWQQLIRNVRVAAFGMGIGQSASVREALAFLLSRMSGTLIIDADGLNVLASLLSESPEALRQASCRVVLTPHPGEFSRLCGLPIPEVQAKSIPLAKSFAARHGVIVLLKGPTTLVTDGDETLLVDRGCPGMATGGSGDVLSGILSAVCATGAPLLQAVAAGAWINGAAGETAQRSVGAISMTAGDTVRALPEVLRSLGG